MIRWGMAAALCVLAGCMSAQSTDCGDGRLCPAGTTCLADVPGCFASEQVEACGGIADGDACQFGAPPQAGSCHLGVCIVAGCGNGLVEDGEQCDDGDQRIGDGCGQTCQREECGNATIDPGEQCDCGTFDHEGGTLPPGCVSPNSDDATCTTACTNHCGDGTVQAFEPCDGGPPPLLSCADVGFDYGELGCTPFCSLDTRLCGAIGLRPVATGFTFDFNAAWEVDVATIVAVTRTGLLTWFDGTSWSTPVDLGAGDLEDVHGTALYDVWTVGDLGFTAHWDATSWTEYPTGTTARLRGVWASASDDVWAVGDQGTVLHWDGAAWSPVPFPDQLTALSSVWSAGGELFIGDFLGRAWHRDAIGGAFTPVQLDNLLFAVVGRATDDVYAAGAYGGIYHWDGTTWTVIDLGIYTDFVDIWLDADEVFLAGNHGEIWHLDDHGWAELTRVSTTSFNAIAGNALDLYAFGDGGAIYHYTGESWLVTETGTVEELRDMWFAAGQIVAGGFDGTVLRETGPTFETLPTAAFQIGPQLRTVDVQGIYAAGPDDIFVSGNAFAEWDGAQWNRLDPFGNWEDLWSAGDGQVTSVGLGGGETWDGIDPILEDLPPELELESVWGTAPRRMIAVGVDGNAWRLAGDTWTSETIAAGDPLHGVWADPGGTVYAVGDGGHIDAYDGTAWTSLPSLGLSRLDGVHGSSVDDVFAVGQGGTLLQESHGVWFRVRTPSIADLEGVWVTPSRVYACGAEGTLLRLLRSTP